MTVQTNSSAHPLIPPLKVEDRLAWLRLLRFRRVGISTFCRLLEEHGTAQCALEHLPEVARAAGVENCLPHSEEHAIAEMRRGHKAGAQLIFRGTPFLSRSVQ
jgi:DNA processing protein